MKLFFVDTETTGIDPRKHGIIQIGALIEIDGETKEELDFKIQPFVTDVTEEEALKIHNISQETIETYTPPRQIYRQLIAIMDKYVDRFDKQDKFHFIGYNARFDSDMLREWFKKCGDVYFGSWFFFPPIDVMNLAAFQCMEKRATLENFKLETVVNKGFGLKLEETSLHDALADIRLTRKLFRLLKKGFLKE